MGDFKVQSDIYEGPLDLLLHLVKKQEVDIYQVDLARLAAEFIAYVDRMRELDLDIAGEFVVMAATLMQIKSRELIPREDRDPEQEDEDPDDPRYELIRQLVEYRKFKDAAAGLEGMEGEQEQVYGRSPARPDLPPVSLPPDLGGTTAFALLQAVNSILSRVRKREEDARHIHADPFTVSEKIQLIRDTLLRSSRVRFSQLFSRVRTRPEVVCTFLAILELIRLHVMRVAQAEPFGEIELEARPPSAEELQSVPSG